MTGEPYHVTDNLEELLAILPPGLAEAIDATRRHELVEIVLDLGRRPEARYPGDYCYLAEEPVSREDLDFVEARVGAFGNDNRAGIPATLHRISALRNRRGTIVGLTLRVGRAVTGIVDIVRDLVESGQSLLVMGRPGLGKTTLLREMARVLSDEVGKRVVIVDTSNEIAGDGDIPHPATGRARRMQVPRVEQQHDVMIEAVENHMPEVIVIDEIGRSEETLAARTIAERGVQLVATVHGNTLDNLLANPVMSDLVGGVQAVTLSDEEARRRRTQKTVLERKAPPTFGVVVEMIERDQVAVHQPVGEAVDAMLRGFSVAPEVRRRDAAGTIHREPASATVTRHGESHAPNLRRAARGHRENPSPGNGDIVRQGGQPANFAGLPPLLPVEEEAGGDEEVTGPLLTEGPLDLSRVRRVFPLGLSRSRLARAIKHLGLSLFLARTWRDADVVLLLTGSNGLSPGSNLLREVYERGLPVVGVSGNTYAEIFRRLNEIFGTPASEERLSPREAALQEARQAAQRVLQEAQPVELRPQSRPLRRLQHQIAGRYHVRSYSVGREPQRRVRFLPDTGHAHHRDHD